MLKQNEIKTLSQFFVQYEKDCEQVRSASTQASAVWAQIIRLLQDSDPEDSDREVLIDECRVMGLATPKIVRHIHKAFDSLGIVSNKMANLVPSRRLALIETAVGQAVSGKVKGKNKSQNRIAVKRMNLALDIERQFEKGRTDRALAVLKSRVWVEFEKLGRLIRDHYDIMTIEDVAKFFQTDYVRAWHKACDEEIAKEKISQNIASSNGGLPRRPR